MEQLVAAQHELLQRIARTHDNLRKAGATRIKGALVASTLKLLDAKWEKLEENHERLQVKYWAEIVKHDYQTKDFIGQAEEAYTQQRAVLLELEESLAAPKDDIRATTGDERPPPRTTLPRIQLPTFSGSYDDWPAFRDLFQSLIVKDTGLSDVARLHYLKASLKGEAELMIKSLPTTGENFERAWKVLKDYYENTRLLVRAHYSAFTSIPKMKGESASDLRRIFHGMMSAVGALESIGRPISSSEDLFVFLTVELLDSRSRREWETWISGSTDPPSYEELKSFMERRLHTLEAMQPSKSEVDTAKTSGGSSRVARSHVAQREERSQKSKEQCYLCRKDHFLMWCEEFRKKPAAERKRFAEDGQLCVNCLKKHKVSECTSKRGCSVCGEQHHTTLHDAYRQSVSQTETTSHIAHGPSKCPAAVLLATARVCVTDRAGNLHSVRALIDQGSEASIISESLAQRLRLPRRRTSVAVFGIGGRQTGVTRGLVDLAISRPNGQQPLEVSAMVLPRLTVYTGVASIAMGDWRHLQGLDLADPNFLEADSVELLLGADAYAVILSCGVRKGGPGEPVAQNTTLGWIVSGTVESLASRATATALQCTLGESLGSLVRRFWEQEEVLHIPAPLSLEEQLCDEHYARTHSRTHEGRYVVRLPVSEPLPDFAFTRSAAARVLAHMERRFSRDTQFRELYADFMAQYVALNHMSRVESASDTQTRACYLPHHGVLKEASTTTRLRVVFNGSLTSSNGESLNGHLQVGPNLLPPLADVLLRWRWHRYVFSADVEKMYRQIQVHPADRDLQRILWKSNQAVDIEEYQLNTVTYGLACAPYLAIRTLRQLADDEEAQYPLGAKILRRDVYVDDVLAGAESIGEARERQQQLVRICRAGGFPLRKWIANDADLLKDFAAEDLAQPGCREWTQHESHSALGIQWHPTTDTFSFRPGTTKRSQPTKRSILSQTAQLFDPLGWIAPAVIRAKILFQSTWLMGLDWDTPLPDNDAEAWATFQGKLLGGIQVPRWLRGSSALDSVEVHGFADASERAYAAVVYLKTTNGLEVDTVLITAKTRVAPLKQVALPRLELCAATLLTRLVSHVVGVLDLGNAPMHLWSDSTVTLGWIRGHPSRWTTFVANRVSEIQVTLPEARWHHVAGSDNPADCASRGLSPDELLSHSLWWRGPSWLTHPAPWDTDVLTEEPEDLPEQRTRAHVGATDEQHHRDSLLLRYSTLRRLLRVTAWCRRWLREGNAAAPRGPILSSDELDQSLHGWIRQEQASGYQEELQTVKKNKCVHQKSVLTKLNPFLDDQGILRVGGRLQHSLLSHDEKHPIILPQDSPLTSLIVDAAHTKVLHGGVQQTLGYVRQRYWIPRGRAAVKARIHRCLQCLRWRAASPQPLMGQLPRARVTPARPFQHTGVDYAGPIMLRTSKGRGHKATKAFLAVFVCMATKAVHLEVASDYSAVAFLAALRRFIARRGLCEAIYSDCGTNFTGADSELRALFTASNQEARHIGHALADEQIRWHFNPPAAPHFGGLWEAAVKSMKHHIRRVLGDATLTYEEMSTLLAQVEACLNSRPLQALTDDPEDMGTSW